MVKATSIYGTDLHIFNDPKETPLILGYDFSGVAEETGKDVTGFQKGDRVIAINPLEERLELARRFGADHLLNPRKTDVVEAVPKLTDGIGVHRAVEDSGSQEAIDLAGEITRPDERILFVGGGRGLRVRFQERVFIEVLVDPWKYPLALKLLAEKRIDVRSLITYEIKSDEI
jgi:threonine dehydrogenase-like Zn-dependent dehydrogenase